MNLIIVYPKLREMIILNEWGIIKLSQYNSEKTALRFQLWRDNNVRVSSELTMNGKVSEVLGNIYDILSETKKKEGE